MPMVRNGGLIGSLNVPTSSSAKGVWSLNDYFNQNKNSTWPPYIAPDPEWANVRLLLRFENNLTDQSGYTTPTGQSGIAYTTSNPKFDSYSLDKPSGAYIDVAGSDNTVFAFGTGSWTVECWVYATAYPGSNVNRNIFSWNRRLVGSGQGPLSFGVTGGTTALKWKPFYYDDNIGAISHSTTFDLNTWNHICICKSGSNMYLGLNGVVESKGTSNRNFDDTNGGTQISNNAYGESLWACRMDEFRVTKGVARYTANYTVPTSRFPNF